MNTLEAIYNRRSCRNFTDEPVTGEQIDTILKAAFSAPTAVNTQPWEYIVINDESVLDKVKEKMYFAKYNAHTAIVVCGNMKLALKGQYKDLWICDCSAAIENMLLAATDLGLGSLWVGIFPIEQRMETMRKILDIPSHVNPLGMVYLGHPVQVEEGRCRYREKAVYYQKYDPSRKLGKKDKPVKGHYD